VDIESALRAELTGRRVVVLGVGNAMRGDDGFGPAVAARLAGAVVAPVLDGGSAPENLAGVLRRAAPEVLLVLDAADFGGAPGELRLLAANELAAGGPSTHAASLAMLFDYLRAGCGTESRVLAVQAGSLTLGDGLSAPVSAAAERAAAMLRETLAAAPKGAPGA
jgi:hydrogenase 3 maturation protease